MFKDTAKQQTPDINQIDNFYSRNILETYEQLVESEQVFRGKNKTIIKTILLYEFANNTQVMTASMPEIFKKDNNCYIDDETAREIEKRYHQFLPFHY